MPKAVTSTEFTEVFLHMCGADRLVDQLEAKIHDPPNSDDPDGSSVGPRRSVVWLRRRSRRSISGFASPRIPENAFPSNGKNSDVSKPIRVISCLYSIIRSRIGTTAKSTYQSGST